MNLLRKVRRQRLVDRAYSNGYEQGRYDEAMEAWDTKINGEQADVLFRIVQLWQTNQTAAEKQYATVLAAQRRKALRDAAEQLTFTPLSERESGALADYTRGIHAAARLVELMAEGELP